jgi:glycosyltransferase involved in cell wall biosynthesis
LLLLNCGIWFIDALQQADSLLTTEEQPQGHTLHTADDRLQMIAIEAGFRIQQTRGGLGVVLRKAFFLFSTRSSTTFYAVPELQKNGAQRKIRIVIDGICLGRKKTGNETYIRGVLHGLASLRAAWESTYAFTVLTTPAHTGERQACFEWVEIPLGHFLERNFLRIPRLLAHMEADLYHATYWIRFWSPPCRTLLVVHDLSFVSFPQGFKRHEQLVYAHVIRWCAQRAEHLATISRFSKGELMRQWNIPENKITYSHLGVDARFQPPPTAMESSSGNPSPRPATPYLLAVGNLHPRKNLARLIEAFVLLKKHHQIPHRLKIVGQAAWLFDDIFQSIRANQLEEEVEFTGYLSESELVETYQKATVMIYPSLYEGFGFPPAEAMACGCPVVCSTAGSLPEVCGDAAIMVDPHSAEAIAEGIASVLTQPALRDQLRKQGFVQSATFTWDACARVTLQAYQKALA